MTLEDVSLVGTKITNANLSKLEINGAQMGGAYIHNIGIPKEGDPHYNPETTGQPVRFENCELRGSQISNCDLSNVNIQDCELMGMKINGILVEDLLKNYQISNNRTK
nr:pentapeptide repeat-containing protein [Lederbergia citrisecunda]